MLSTFLSAVGIATLGVFCVKVILFVKVNFMTTNDMKRKYGKAGGWALVTGASEGIGHAMALDLGRRGFNVCVIARTKSKLDVVVDELRGVGVEGRAISFDFAEATPADWTNLCAQLDTLEIAVLVNNVGVNYDYTNYFDEVPLQTDLRLLKVNCESTLRMSKYVVPNMRAKGAGAIVCLSSFSGITPTPLLATYAGTKAFNGYFGNALSYELKHFGIDVLTVTPNLVVSRMTQGVSTRKPRETFLTVNADQMAHQTLDRLGSVYQTAGHRNHVIIEAIIKLMPVDFISNQILKLHISTKKRAEKRLKTK
ncbi:unnamed protein product [Phytomonas sp. Hart1]|nr:unnamed protein product [Phytomonas sp. Hart1]|eukprot:CCW72331.1 unnamed protein product [Phytomonas sp. isolate Hart1]